MFAVIAAQEAHLPGADTILLTAYLTIGLSVLLHGISAAPWRGAMPIGTNRTRATAAW